MIEKMLDNNEEPIEDENEIITIDYFDRIHNQMIKVDVTRKVANYLKSNTQKQRRKQNKYNYHNTSMEKYFKNIEEDEEEKEKYLVDNKADIEATIESKSDERVESAVNEYKKALVENALESAELSERQKEVITKTFYDNKAERKIAEELNIGNTTVHYHKQKGVKKIKNYISDTQN
jgi:DNA-directed RNA polymerase specialized sigma subunit